MNCGVCGFPISSALQGGERSQKVVVTLPLVHPRTIWYTAPGTLVRTVPVVHWSTGCYTAPGTLPLVYPGTLWYTVPGTLWYTAPGTLVGTLPLLVKAVQRICRH